MLRIAIAPNFELEVNMDIRTLLQGLPPVLQYIAVIALVMVILYVCLTLTRLLGAKHGEKVDYNDPEKADQMVPDLFASTAFRRKKKDAAMSGSEQDSDSKEN